MFACAKRQFCHETDRLANAITVASGSQYYRLSFAPLACTVFSPSEPFRPPRQTTGASPAAGGGLRTLRTSPREEGRVGPGVEAPFRCSALGGAGDGACS